MLDQPVFVSTLILISVQAERVTVTTCPSSNACLTFSRGSARSYRPGSPDGFIQLLTANRIGPRLLTNRWLRRTGIIKNQKVSGVCGRGLEDPAGGYVAMALAAMGFPQEAT